MCKQDQYIFIHDALLNFIESGGRTDIQPRKFRTLIDDLDSNFDTSGETILEKQYKMIGKWSPPSHLTNTAMLDVNQHKNRNLSFIPCKLMCSVEHDGCDVCKNTKKITNKILLLFLFDIKMCLSLAKKKLGEAKAHLSMG